MKRKNVFFEKEEELKAETEKRVCKMKQEFAEEPRIKVFQNSQEYDQIVAQVGIPYMSLCEHHEVAFSGEVSVGYIPDQTIIGLSKIGRIVEYFLNPTLPTLQEKATKQIIDYLENVLEPKGLIVVVTGVHGCIAYRGIKKPSTTITSAVKGVMREEKSAREEFLLLTNQCK